MTNTDTAVNPFAAFAAAVVADTREDNRDPFATFGAAVVADARRPRSATVAPKPTFARATLDD